MLNRLVGKLYSVDERDLASWAYGFTVGALTSWFICMIVVAAIDESRQAREPITSTTVTKSADKWTMRASNGATILEAGTREQMLEKIEEYVKRGD